MAKKEKTAKTSFSYDRLWEQKLSQVYQLLVPDLPDTRPPEYPNPHIEVQEYENSSNIHTGVLRGTKGKQDGRQPGR